MSTNVVMPQMGESIAEGTIVRWIKKVGDTVDRDEPLFEISTDKVDAEIPSPAAGVITEIRRQGRGDGPGQQRRRRDRRRRRRSRRRRLPAGPAEAPPRSSGAAGAAAGRRSRQPETQRPGSAAGGRPLRRDRPSKPGAANRRGWIAGRSRRRSCGKIAQEHNVDITQIHGTGIAAA